MLDLKPLFVNDAACLGFRRTDESLVEEDGQKCADRLAEGLHSTIILMILPRLLIQRLFDDLRELSDRERNGISMLRFSDWFSVDGESYVPNAVQTPELEVAIRDDRLPVIACFSAVFDFHYLSLSGIRQT